MAREEDMPVQTTIVSWKTINPSAHLDAANREEVARAPDQESTFFMWSDLPLISGVPGRGPSNNGRREDPVGRMTRVDLRIRATSPTGGGRFRSSKRDHGPLRLVSSKYLEPMPSQ